MVVLRPTQLPATSLLLRAARKLIRQSVLYIDSNNVLLFGHSTYGIKCNDALSTEVYTVLVWELIRAGHARRVSSYLTALDITNHGNKIGSEHLWRGWAFWALSRMAGQADGCSNFMLHWQKYLPFPEILTVCPGRRPSCFHTDPLLISTKRIWVNNGLMRSLSIVSAGKLQFLPIMPFLVINWPF